MHPFEQQVRERAYFIWEGEGRMFGHATEHWLRAERELAGDTPIQVHPVAAEISLAPSPARALKPKAGARSAAAKVAGTITEASAKSATAKPSSTKAATPRSASAKIAPVKTAGTKSAATNSAAAKSPAAKSPAPKTAAARSKAFGAETGVVMH